MEIRVSGNHVMRGLGVFNHLNYHWSCYYILVTNRARSELNILKCKWTRKRKEKGVDETPPHEYFMHIMLQSERLAGFLSSWMHLAKISTS